jgi:hypothetical protein
MRVQRKTMASWSVEEPEQIVNLLTELSRTT